MIQILQHGPFRATLTPVTTLGEPLARTGLRTYRLACHILEMFETDLEADPNGRYLVIEVAYPGEKFLRGL